MLKTGSIPQATNPVSASDVSLPACLHAEKPNRLVSLWELMRLFDAALIAGTVRLVEDYRVLGEMWVVPGTMIPPHSPETDSALERAQNHCVELGLNASVVSFEKIRRHIAEKPDDNKGIGKLAAELGERLFDEMSQKLYLSLTFEETVHYLAFRQNWEAILDRFPETLTDIEEARKCFALARYAASVFHSVQVIEVGLIELGGFISVNDPHSGWTAVCSQLKRIVEKKYADRSDIEKQNWQFLEQVQGTAEALKNAWRNKISHAMGD
jgi:hypothetical protein